MDASFSAIYDLFTPFFFIEIGISIDPEVLLPALGIGVPLLLAAIAGKMVGVGAAAWPMLGMSRAVLIGVSMMPRAEMAMVVMQQGKAMGDWFIPEHLYAAIVMIVLITSISSPVLLRALMNRYPQSGKEDG